MSDWRYWITYAGKISGANTEAEARAIALGVVMFKIRDGQPLYPLVDVEEVGEGE